MTTATARDQIYAALRLIGQLAEGETPSAATTLDALTAMNQMLDSWSIERLSVFTTQTQVFTWPANTATRTLGPTGNFVGSRPVAVDDSTYFVDPANGISYPIHQVSQEQYNGLALKTVTSTYPQVMALSSDMPNLGITLFPIPDRALQFHFVSVQELAEPPNLSTVLAFPPGYLRAFKYNLAMEIAPEFGVEPSPQVKRIAMTSKRNLKRVNDPKNYMSMPEGIATPRSRFNVFSGV